MHVILLVNSTAAKHMWIMLTWHILRLYLTVCFHIVWACERFQFRWDTIVCSSSLNNTEWKLRVCKMQTNQMKQKIEWIVLETCSKPMVTAISNRSYEEIIRKYSLSEHMAAANAVQLDLWKSNWLVCKLSIASGLHSLQNNQHCWSWKVRWEMKITCKIGDFCSAI